MRCFSIWSDTLAKLRCGRQKSRISRPLPPLPIEQNPWEEEVRFIRNAMNDTSLDVGRVARLPSHLTAYRNAAQRVSHTTPDPVPENTTQREPRTRQAHRDLDQEGPFWNPLHCSPAELEVVGTELGTRTTASSPFATFEAASSATARPRHAPVTPNVALPALTSNGGSQADSRHPRSTRHGKRPQIYGLENPGAHTFIDRGTDEEIVSEHSFGTNTIMNRTRQLLDSVHIKASRLLFNESEDEHYYLPQAMEEVLARAMKSIWDLWTLLKKLNFDADMIYVQDGEWMPDLVSHLEDMQAKIVAPRAMGTFQKYGVQVPGVKELDGYTTVLSRMHARLKMVAILPPRAVVGPQELEAASVNGSRFARQIRQLGLDSADLFQHHLESE